MSSITMKNKIDSIDSLSEIDKQIASIFAQKWSNKQKQVNILNDLLQRHHFLVRKLFFLTSNKVKK